MKHPTFLRNRNSAGAPSLTAFLGTSGDHPIVGDWTSKGYDSIGVYRPSTETYYLRNSNTSSIYADLTVIYGSNGDKPLVGQWILQPDSSKASHRASATTATTTAATLPTRRSAMR